MAKNLGIISGSLFAGNPIIVSVTPGDALTDVTFLQMKVKVLANLSDSAGHALEFILSAPAQAGVPVEVDISSALRSTADAFVFDKDTLEVPLITYQVSAWEEYFEEGVFKKSAPIQMQGTQQALMGAFTDMERYLNDGAFKAVQQFSRKPDYGEVVAKDATFVQPVPFPRPMTNGLVSGQHSRVIDLSKKSGIVPIRYSDLYNYDMGPMPKDFVVRTIYVDESSADRYHFLFVNSRGALESISAQCLSEETQQFSQSTQVVARPETFNKFSRRVRHVSGAVRTLKMSTGWLTEEWAEWWASEFLMAEMVWIKVKGTYVPCLVQPAEDTKIIKRSATDVISLDFSVQLGLGC